MNRKDREKATAAAFEDYRAELADGIEAYGGTIPDHLKEQVAADRAARDARTKNNPS